MELCCSNLKQWEGPSVYIGAQFTWPCVVTSGLRVGNGMADMAALLTL